MKYSTRFSKFNSPQAKKKKKKKLLLPVVSKDHLFYKGRNFFELVKPKSIIQHPVLDNGFCSYAECF